MSAYWPKSLMSKSPITVALFTTDPKFYVKWGAKTIFTNVFQLNFTNKWGSSIDKKIYGLQRFICGVFFSLKLLRQIR